MLHLYRLIPIYYKYSYNRSTGITELKIENTLFLTSLFCQNLHQCFNKHIFIPTLWYLKRFTGYCYIRIKQSKWAKARSEGILFYKKRVNFCLSMMSCRMIFWLLECTDLFYGCEKHANMIDSRYESSIHAGLAATKEVIPHSSNLNKKCSFGWSGEVFRSNSLYFGMSCWLKKVNLKKVNLLK